MEKLYIIMPNLVNQGFGYAVNCVRPSKGSTEASHYCYVHLLPV